MNPLPSNVQPSVSGAAPVIVIYDDQCSFCQKRIAWIQSRARPGDFEYVPSRTAGLADRFPVLRSQDFNTGLRVVLPSGALRVGADSVYEIALRLPGWRGVAQLYRVPLIHSICRGIYAWVAKRRHRLA